MITMEVYFIHGFLVYYLALIFGVALIITIGLELYGDYTDYRILKGLIIALIICAVIVVYHNL